MSQISSGDSISLNSVINYYAVQFLRKRVGHSHVLENLFYFNIVTIQQQFSLYLSTDVPSKQNSGANTPLVFQFER